MNSDKKSQFIDSFRENVKIWEHTFLELSNDKCTHALSFIANIKKSLSTTETNTTKEQGDLLENLINIYFENSELFDIHQNLRTSTNEVDVVLTLKTSGKKARVERLIPSWIDDIIFMECKNYKNKVSVTYLGKFFSLMHSHNCKLGFFISTNGISGEKKDKISWKDAAGFVKKTNLKYSLYDPPTILIPINIDQLKNNIINHKGNFIKLIEKLKYSIDLDTNEFLNHINKHDKEGDVLL